MITFSHLAEAQWGRLGNQLFQIASTIGIARKNKQDFIFPEWKYAGYFAHNLPYGTLDSATVFMYKSFNFSDIQLAEGDWDLMGFFPSEKFFLHVEDEIRWYFEPSAEISGYIQQRYGELLKGETCSIHVRRGDYLKQRFSFPPQSVKYFRKAIDSFSEETRFIVCSEDINWCKQHFKGDRFTFIEGESDIVDLLIMSYCRHHIISNSSFSWWSAWLNKYEGKRIVSPEHWLGPKGCKHPDEQSKDLYASKFEKLRLNESWLAPYYYRLYVNSVYWYFNIHDLILRKLRAVKRSLNV